MHSKNYFITMALLLSIGSTSVIAKSQTSGICKDSVFDYYPGRIPPDYYGNSRTNSFNCALHGSAELTPEQQRERNKLIPKSHNYSVYIRGGINAAAQVLRGIKNKTKTAGTTFDKKVNETEARKASNSFDIALGYKWQDVSLEIEWLNLDSFNYNSYLLATDPVLRFQSKVKGHAIMLGANFEYYKLGIMYPYIGLNLGIVQNESLFSFNGSANKIKRKFGPAVGIGFGAKFNIYSNLYADAVLRLIYLDKVVFDSIDTSPLLKLEAQRFWAGASIRLMWLF